MSIQPAKPPLIRVTEAREVLAYVPHALGFQPRSSAVLLSLRPPRGRIGLVVRVDLDDLTGPDGAMVARGLGRHLGADGAAGTFLVIYYDESVARARISGAVRSAVRLLERTLDVPVRDAWVVASDGYASVRCKDLRCCPVAGHPLETLVSTQIGAAMVMAGSAPAANRAGLRIGEDLDQGRRAAFEAGRRLTRRRRAREAAAGRAEAWREEAASTCMEVVGAGVVESAVAAPVTGAGAGADPQRLGELAESLRDVLVRDCLLVALLVAVPGSRDPRDLDAGVAQLFAPGAPPPERARVDRAREVLTDAARLAAGRQRGALVGMLSWVAWWCGEGAAAAVLMDEAFEYDADDRMALLVRRALETGTAPGWVRPARK